MVETTVSSFQLITYLIKDVFGTYLVEEGKWDYPNYDNPIGRTYFLDRKKAKSAINDRTINNISRIYNMALTGNSVYDPLQISQNFARVIKQNFHFNVDYMILFPDDTNALRKAKIDAINQLLVFSLLDFRGISSYDPNNLHFGMTISQVKLISLISMHSLGTYTEIVLKNLHVTDSK